MTPYSKSTRHATHVYLHGLFCRGSHILWAGLAWLDIPTHRTHRTRNRRTTR